MAETTNNNYLVRDTPLYGTIPYMGNEWSVTFRAKGTETSCLSGYGNFPFERFPAIPVIDYRSNNAVFQALKLTNEDRPAEANPAYTSSLPEFLAKIAGMGIEIINHNQK